MYLRIFACRLTTIDYVLILQLAVHYITYWVFVVFLDPAKEVSVGLHEPVGPCNEMASLTTPFGQVLCPITNYLAMKFVRRRRSVISNHKIDNVIISDNYNAAEIS